MQNITERTVNLNIRPLASDEVGALQVLAVLAWEPVFVSFRKILGEWIFPSLYPDWRQGQRDAVAKVCADDSGMTVLVADVDGVIADFIAYVVDDSVHSGEVDLLAVLPDY